LNDRLAPEMRVVNAVPSSTPDPQAAWPEFKEIKVTTVAENTSEADAEVTRSGPFGKSQSLTLLHRYEGRLTLGNDIRSGHGSLSA